MPLLDTPKIRELERDEVPLLKNLSSSPLKERGSGGEVEK